jgi:hypothetical protein
MLVRSSGLTRLDFRILFKHAYAFIVKGIKSAETRFSLVQGETRQLGEFSAIDNMILGQLSDGK